MLCPKLKYSAWNSPSEGDQRQKGNIITNNNVLQNKNNLGRFPSNVTQDMV